jgi:erythromycin esterase-like protein
VSNPPLVFYPTVDAYREHYLREYCRQWVLTVDDIRVHFKPDQFAHLFYESSSRDGSKDVFSHMRAQRIDWIKATLQHRQARWFQGWDKKAQRYGVNRRVAVVYESFVVVISLRYRKNGTPKAEIITSYQADNSIKKILKAPPWTQEDWVKYLGGGT